MNKKVWLRKTLVLASIMLFVGIAVQPGIIADDSFEYDNSELVEITVNIGKYEYTLMLSQDKVKELKDLISRIKNELNTAENLKETSTIFSNTIVSLHELDMLPDDISIKNVQRLVNVINLNSRIDKKLEGLSGKNMGNLDNEENRLCLIAGHTDETYFIGPCGLLSMLMIGVLFKGDSISPVFFPDLLLHFYMKLKGIIPIAFGDSIYLGEICHSTLSHLYFPSHGWIYTNGLNGIKEYNGSFIGNLSFLNPGYSTGAIGEWCSLCSGVLGFSGIRISLLNGYYFYLGAALRVKIG